MTPRITYVILMSRRRTAIKKSKVLPIRVTERLKDRIEQAAHEDGITLTDLITIAVHDHLRRRELLKQGGGEKE